jgi:tripartite-type tricarboxylate transporter receptor subunit TctC
VPLNGAAQSNRHLKVNDAQGEDVSGSRSHRIAALIALFVALSSNHGTAETRTIKFIVPFPAGGGADVLMRTLSDRWAQSHGITNVIENRPGGATVIGTEAASRAAPDGNTLVVAANSFVVHANFKKLSYDPLTSFEPICLMANSPQVLVVNSASPYRTLNDLIEAARAKPSTISHASAGPASAQHIGFEQLKLMAKINMVFVPFPGNTPALNALLGGHVDSVVANYSEAAALVKSGKLRALAALGDKRVAAWPNVATAAEQGFKGLSVEAWYGLLAPAKTPKDKVAELSNWCAAGMKAADLKPKWELQGLDPVGSSSEEFAAHLRKQAAEYAQVIREAGIKGE